MNTRIPSATDDQGKPPESPARPSVSLFQEEDAIAVVRFDRPGSSANILDSGTLHLLAEVLSEVGSRSLRGVIFESAKPAVFIAGADLKELAGTQDRAALVDLGQQIFSGLAALRCVTVAAIHGACAGGGLEMALACDYRIASDARATRIGLPEVNLGLIPAWGGSTRLPRLVGLARALEIILGANLMPASKARRLGVVDALCPRERLQFLAKRFVDKGKAASPRRHLPWIPAWKVAAALARKSALKKTRGHYPAPLSAIEVVAKACVRSIPQSLAAEKEAILRLAATDVCGNLIRVFFLQERAKRLPGPKAEPIGTTAVIGAGIMGSGIAQWVAARGREVLLRDVGPDELAQGLQRAEKLFSEAQRRRLFSRAEARAGLDRIVPVEVAVPMKSVDLVIEAASEKMPVKKAIFADLEERVRPETILATNTSALSITEISRDLQHPTRVVGLHFFNPVHRMKLVEVARGEFSSEVAIDTAVVFVQRIGKFPVVVRDRPGFLVNRILLPYLLEAGRLFAAGAEVEALDESMLDFGMPMGPLRLLDEVGLDVAADVGQTLCTAFPDRMQPPGVFAQLLDAGFKGRKSGRGFYEYRGNRVIGINRFALGLREAEDKAG
ncbi:MAG TPA: 3-hydroxyacyl-CoA dehydrogenase NAD-binding domain-containing protein, partial [Terrimicrobiaceae bacterium]|nr:3-hydroxyacyl-CoA dehydrogenase NAD-binding domain-containing protein [Terrimicrobiaceae bacterium]